jgi:PEP-CTERM motif
VFDSSGDLLGPTTISHYTSVAGDLNWTVFNGVFTANQAIASLDFKSLDGFSYGGILLDGVSINAVPEPAGIILIGIGASSLLGYLLFRKARAHGARGVRASRGSGV